MEQTDVLVIGELLADVISQQYVNGLDEASTFAIFPGGSPANVCGNLNWLGAKAKLFSCVGNDGIGKMILQTISKAGIDTSYIKTSSTQPTTLVLVGRSKSTPDFIAYRHADTAIDRIDEKMIEGTRMIHTSAFALSKNPAQQNILHSFWQAHQQHKLVSVDWNFAPSLWSDNGQEVFNTLMTMEPLLKVSLDDMERFLGHNVSIEESKHFLSKLTAKITCLTCGKDGVWYRSKDQDWKFTPAQPVDEVKDTTGAGDAFWSGFLFAYLNHHTLAECIAEGIALATKKISKLGPLYA